MFLTRETVTTRLAKLPPNSRERRPLERFARDLTSAELELEQALLESIIADANGGLAF